MKQFVLAFCLLMMQGVSVSAIHIVTHPRVTVVTNPKTGLNAFPRWGVFPGAETSVRRIVLHLTLGTPDSLPTAHWDYCDHVIIRRQGGMKADSLNLEIARMLTPYGSMYDKGWQFEWSVDVTDFAPWLRDSVEIEYLHSGYEPESLGWALTLDFEITEGPEIQHFLGMTPLWKGHFKYGDSTRTFDEQVLPLDITPERGAATYRLRIQHTGHGMDSPGNCSEFCPRQREIRMDGKQVDFRTLWKDCGDNPLYPQGGTWVYDRALWCPGDLQAPDIIDIPASQGSHRFELSLNPYTAKENIQAVENITAYLFAYGSLKAGHDVRIEDILVPTEKQQWGRLNPAGFGIRIRIRNLGNQPLKSLIIRYGPEGTKGRTYPWTGNLKSMATEDIMLPGLIACPTSEGRFHVELHKPNGRKDAWIGDNEMVTPYHCPKMLPVEMRVQFKTNRHGKENGVYLLNSRLDTVFMRHSAHLDSMTLYTDTLRLIPGQYRMELRDTAGNGLEFWAEPDQGEGFLRLFDLKGHLIHLFNPDCGNGEILHFNADPGYVFDSTQAPVSVTLSPRQTRNEVQLEVICPVPSSVSVQIKVDKVLKEHHEYQDLLQGNFHYQLGWLPKGRVVVEVLVNGKSRFKGRVTILRDPQTGS